MLKQDIRKLFRKKRDELSLPLKEKYDLQISQKFREFVSDTVNSVHIFLPIKSKKEIDTWTIIHQLWEQNLDVIVPKMHEGKNEISSCKLTPTTKLEENSWGVPEPVQAVLINESKIDAVVVPLLAYEPEGYRVGYGKGFYDNFLIRLGEKVMKIGLSYFPPVAEITDIDDWDIPMDVCITPDAIYQF